jgi:phage terminase large subunit GpA-like protein
MTHDHHPNAEFLYPSDAEILDLYNEGNSIAIRFALPCPDCDETLELTATVDHIGETDLEIPLDDAEDRYD